MPEDLELSGDWAQGAALLCANALGSGVRVENLRGSAQGPGGDARILALLGEMGLSVFGTREEWYLTSPSRAPLLPLKAHCGDVADLSPLLALLCTQAWGESVLSGIGGSGAKGLAEATVALLTQMGARAALSPGDALVIRGPSRLQGGFQVDAAGIPGWCCWRPCALVKGPGGFRGGGFDQSWPGFGPVPGPGARPPVISRHSWTEERHDHQKSIHGPQLPSPGGGAEGICQHEGQTVFVEGRCLESGFRPQP